MFSHNDYFNVDQASDGETLIPPGSPDLNVLSFLSTPRGDKSYFVLQIILPSNNYFNSIIKHLWDS